MKIVKVGSTKLGGKPLSKAWSKKAKKAQKDFIQAKEAKARYEPVKQAKPTNALLKRRATRMRNYPTIAERRMMERLTEYGINFRPQVVIGWFIADILIEERMLIVELDGNHHYTSEGEVADYRRTKWLQQFGFQIFRIPNEDVEKVDLKFIDTFPIVKGCSDAIGKAQKERNRCLYYPPVQQEKWKAKRKQKKQLQEWEKVPQVK